MAMRMAINRNPNGSVPAGHCKSRDLDRPAGAVIPAGHSWFARIRDGDLDAFDELFRTMYPVLCDFALRYVDSAAVAEDLVQDVFVAVWRRRSRLGTEGSELAFLFTATRNRALDHLRRERLRKRWNREQAVRQDVAAGSSPAEHQTDLAAVSAAYEASLSRMPDRRRDVFLLSREAGYSYAEIARQLGISVKTVEVQMGRALKTLRRDLASFLEPA